MVARQTRNWPYVTGKITKSECVEFWTTDTNGGQQQEFYWKLQYTYLVASQQFESDDWSLSRLPGGAKKWVEKMVKRYPVDGEVDVFYNRSRPYEAVLDTSTPKVTLQLCLGALLLGSLIIGVGYFIGH